MELNLTEDQINVCKDAFSRADENQDGYIDAYQLKLALKHLGALNATNKMSDAQLQQQVKDLSGNRGEIGFSEFLSFMSYKLKDADSQMGTLQAFKFFDRNNSGKISRQQLKIVIMNLGSAHGMASNGSYRGNAQPQMRESEAEELLSEIDPALIDERGLIDYERFVQDLFGNL